MARAAWLSGAQMHACSGSFVMKPRFCLYVDINITCVHHYSVHVRHVAYKDCWVDMRGSPCDLTKRRALELGLNHIAV